MNKQAGMSFNSVLVLIVVIGLGVRIAGTLVPMYYDYFMMQQVMSGLHESNSITSNTSKGDIEEILEQRITSNKLDIPLEELDVEKRKGLTTVSLDYSVRSHFVGNLFFVGEFSFQEEFK